MSYHSSMKWDWNEKVTKKLINTEFQEIADEILVAIENVKPREWATWDCFAGRQVIHTQRIEDAKKEAIIDVLMKRIVSC